MSLVNLPSSVVARASVPVSGPPGPMDDPSFPPQDWGYVTLLGYTFLGKITGERASKLEVRQYLTGDGAKISQRGKKPKQIHVQIRFWNTVQKTNLKLLIGQLFTYANAVTPQGIAVAHEALEMIGITQLYFVGSQVPEIRDSASEGTVNLIFWDFLPSSSKAGAGNGTLSIKTPATPAPGGTVAPASSNPVPTVQSAVPNYQPGETPLQQSTVPAPESVATSAASQTG